MASVNRRVLPGFSLTLGYTVFYLSVLVLIPIAGIFIKASTLSLDEFVKAVWSERARAAYTLTFGAAFIAAAVNVVLGLLLAWVLVRYSFPGRKLIDSLIDLPLALPTAVVGLPFVVRSVQPILEDLDAESEEASASLGGTRWQTFRHVIFPTLSPALI